MKVRMIDVNKFDLITKWTVMILISLIELAFGVVFIWFAANYPSEDWKWFMAGAIFLILICVPLFFFLWIPWCIRWLQGESDYILRDKENLR